MVQSNGKQLAKRLLEQLDAEQKEAVTAPLGPLCIVAGAGTGKTRTLTHRVAYWHHLEKAPGPNVLIVTHSNKAAGELRTRLAGLGVGQARASTFHAAALRQLSYFWKETGLPGNGPLLVESLPNKDYGLLRTALGKKLKVPGGKLDADMISDVMTEIRWAKARGLSEGRYLKAAGTAGRVPSATTLENARVGFVAYEKERQNLGLLDFDDLLSCCTELIEQNNWVAERIKSQYQHILVDEFQDTDTPQYKLLLSWLGSNNSIAVVGDPRQTIYSFKGAQAKYLDTFGKSFDGKVINLVKDYRSSDEIVRVANNLVAKSTGTVKTPPLVAGGSQGPKARSVMCQDQNEEVDFLVQNISNLLKDGFDGSQIAVLLRTQAAVAAVSVALGQAGIKVGNQSGDFFAIPIVAQIITGLHSYAPMNEDGLNALDNLLQKAGYDKEDKPEGVGAWRDRFEALSALDQVGRKIPSGKRRTPAELAMSLTVPVSHSSGVTVATIHGAKGLEWDAVFIPHLNEGTLPIVHAKTQDAIEEERRLLYVAITRAKSIVCLSYATGFSLENGRRIPLKPSRFISQLKINDKPERVMIGEQKWEVGQLVNHDKYGVGKIISIRKTLRIDFGSVGMHNVQPTDAKLATL